MPNFFKNEMKETSAIRYEMEFPFNVSPQLLFEYISTPSGLSNWFADDVNSSGDIYTFSWEDSQEQAKMLMYKLDESVRFRWTTTNDNAFFEMKILYDEITQDVSLLVIDFAHTQQEKEASELYWSNQINDLKHILGNRN